jgi:DNA-binding transcriptional LysR family regulator
MDLQALRIFKAVAEEGGIARAAKLLNCVQSNVSTRVKQLERRLGIQLFYRVNGHLVITNEGSQLLGYAQRILRLTEEAQSSLRAGRELAGKLRIGSVEATVAARLPHILAHFHEHYPKVGLTIETGSTDHVTQRVLSHQLDIAFISGPIVADDLIQHSVFEEELQLIVGPRHKAVNSVVDLTNCHFLALRAGCPYRARFERWLGKGGVVPGVIIEFDTFEMVIACVGAGMGVSLMPKSLIGRQERGGVIKAYAVPEDVAKAKTSLIWHKDIAQHSVRAAFVRCLKNEGPDPLS